VKQKRKTSKRHGYGAMKADQLNEATAAYGREMAIDAFRPLTKAERARWDRARRNPGRPRRGKGVKVISVSVEQDLLAESDRLARRLGMSRARLIERGLRVMLEGAGK
jgi:Tfp pilus assembly protein PilF